MSLSITKEQAREISIAISLISLGISIYNKIYWFLPAILIILLISLFIPLLIRLIFSPIKVLLSKYIGPALSWFLLILCFYLVILPLGLLRRINGSDPLQIRYFQKRRVSAFTVKDKNIKKKDLIKPY